LECPDLLCIALSGLKFVPSSVRYVSLSCVSTASKFAARQQEQRLEIICKRSKSYPKRGFPRNIPFLHGSEAIRKKTCCSLYYVLGTFLNFGTTPIKASTLQIGRMFHERPHSPTRLTSYFSYALLTVITHKKQLFYKIQQLMPFKLPEVLVALSCS